MNTSALDSVKKREKFLIKTYQENSSSSFSLAKTLKRKKADELLKVLRKRYGFENAPKPLTSDLNWANITSNGRYALD